MGRMAMVIGMALGLVLAGCESQPVSPQGEGEVWVGVQGDGASGSSASRALIGGGSESAAKGSVAVRARVYLRSAAGEWVEVTRGHAEQVVRADGSDGVQVLTSGEVAAETYGRVRVEFEEVRASLTGDARIGMALGRGTLGVELGADQRAVVERELAVRIRPGAQARVIVNLNADAWLKQASAETSTVAEGSFESAVTITGG